MFSKDQKLVNPLDLRKSVVVSYRDAYLLQLIVNSQLASLTYMYNRSMYVDPDYLHSVKSLSERIDILVDSFENDLPF